MAEHLPGLLSLFNQVSNEISNQESWENLFEEMNEFFDYFSEYKTCQSKDYKVWLHETIQFMEFVIQHRSDILESNFVRCMAWVANSKSVCSAIVPKYIDLNFPKLFHGSPCIMGDFVWRLVETNIRLPEDQVNMYITLNDIQEVFHGMPDCPKRMLRLVRAGITSC
jgi:hypothetical protein